ncbi:uncharacterized protein EV154DRAFT_505037 [Mucor mucedo]|uniref:uncharacterized protein n=1 Tax=Mucor mucedo TaxID=29922 RepID=UPI00221F2E6C|nr:uncharacterized protein EV154DRAFT_505037 [Mucor mucedo]KAI7892410.1 hypothetical protein EV154DRAFT_505037 [Mucor mucedo]
MNAEVYKKQVHHRPIPFAVLKLQFKRLVAQQDNATSIYTKDLLSLIDQYEHTENVMLLTDLQKKAILPYTRTNPDLEMTADDILNLLRLVCPNPVTSLSAPTQRQPLNLETIRPRTSPPLKTNKSTPWKRRPSAVASSIGHRNDLNQILSQQQQQPEEEHQQLIENISTSLTNMSHSIDTPARKDDEPKSPIEQEYSNQDLARYYRRSLLLTQRLKSSEKSLASMARDNEDRIVQLQNRVDDMNLEVGKQRREIQEYKGKEKNSLDQIGALESHISHIQRSETDQKQVYQSIKMLFDDKCQETQKLQEMLRQKESDLQKTEALLNNFHHEVQLLSQERARLIGLQNNLEQEMKTSAQAHQQLAEQKTENEKLKDIIDTLKVDLDEALFHHHTLDTVQEDEALEESHAFKTLENELITDEKDGVLKSVQDEKDYYKTRATEAKEDLDRVKSELDYLRRALDSENRSLVNELAELRIKASTTTTDIPQIEMNIPVPLAVMNDFWSQSRARPRNTGSNKKKGRTVQDLHESSSSTSFVITSTNKDLKIMNRKDDKIINNTVTFALYTVAIYFFGIVTSTFLMEGGVSTAPPWEQALAAASTGQIPKSKLLEIILYWLEKLLIEPQGLPVS